MERGEFKQQAERKVEVWSYEGYLREYLLLCAKTGEAGLESIQKFPTGIELNSIWHGTMDQMERETHDGYEHWALVGFREDMQHIVLPQIFGTGTKGWRAQVPSAVIEKGVQEAKKRTGLVDLLGHIHSHPNSLYDRIMEEYFGSIRVLHEGPGFSAGDLFWVATNENFVPMIGLVQGRERFFAFRTRESGNVQTGSILYSQEAFEKYWAKKLGVKWVGNFPIPPLGFRVLKMDEQIAESHNLVLYRGISGEDLKRIFP